MGKALSHIVGVNGNQFNDCGNQCGSYTENSKWNYIPAIPRPGRYLKDPKSVAVGAAHTASLCCGAIQDRQS